jgi:hypothetical protein
LKSLGTSETEGNGLRVNRQQRAGLAQQALDASSSVEVDDSNGRNCRRADKRCVGRSRFFKT